MAQVTRSTTSSHEERSQAPSAGSASRQTIHTTGDRETSRPRQSRQRLSHTDERLHISTVRSSASSIAPASAGSHHVQRITGGPSSMSQEMGPQPSRYFRTAAMNRLVAGSAGPDTVRQARSRARLGSRGETQDQIHSTSMSQGHLAGLRGQWRPSSGSAPQSARLVPLMGNLTLGVEPSTRLSGEQQAPDGSSAKPPNAPLAAFPPSGNFPPATSASARPTKSQPPPPQVIEESLRNSSVRPMASTRSPIIPPPRTIVQATDSSVRHLDRTGAGTAAGSSTSASQSGPRVINIGIETELILVAHREDHAAETLAEFVNILAADHNLRVRGTQKRMRIDLRPMRYVGEYTEWCLVRDQTIDRDRSPCKPLPIPVSHDISDRFPQGGLSWSPQFSGPAPAHHGEEMWKRLGDIFTSIIRSHQISHVLPTFTFLSNRRVNSPWMISAVSQDVSYTLNQLWRL